MKLLKYMLMLAAGAVASTGCTDITDYPDGRMDFEHIFQNPKLVGGYMNACYVEGVNGYGDFFGDKTYMASATRLMTPTMLQAAPCTSGTTAS